MRKTACPEDQGRGRTATSPWSRLPVLLGRAFWTPRLPPVFSPGSDRGWAVSWARAQHSVNHLRR
eukprot:5735715-Alexandrium_andersonii.AAC.1